MPKGQLGRIVQLEEKSGGLENAISGIAVHNENIYVTMIGGRINTCIWNESCQKLKRFTCTNIPFLFLDNIMESRIERQPSIQSLLKEDHEDDLRSKDEPPLDKTKHPVSGDLNVQNMPALSTTNFICLTVVRSEWCLFFFG